jgi:hypothetical protein
MTDAWYMFGTWTYLVGDIGACLVEACVGDVENMV